MALTLYYVPNTRAGRCRWMLEELAVPYEMVRVDVAGKANKTPEYLATVHPLGHVPALRDGTTTLFESMAIVMYLADRFPEAKLAPALAAPERAAYLQWMVYAVTELEPGVAKVWYHEQRRAPEERIAAVAAEGRAQFAAAAGVLEERLVGRPYLLGDEFSAADLMTAAVLGWARGCGLLDAHPTLLDYMRRCTGRPAAKRARAD